MFVQGSEPSVQVFVPGYRMEEALEQLDRFLASERYERIDLSIARRYDLDDSDEEYPSEYVLRDMQQVASSRKCGIGVVVYSRETCTPLEPPDA
jgi:hypothetical protein